ncbi:MAG: RluA family pseudouridine synthase [Clostridium sp.]
MSILKAKVENKYDGFKIRAYLKEELSLSTRLIRGASIEKRILVNGNAVKMDFAVKEGDEIQVNLSRKETQDIAPEKMDINIVYEDDEILVLNKAPYMVVHPTKSYQSGTLANGIMYYFKESSQNCIVRLVSRLDMNTSGLIIIAKNQFAHMYLSKEMQENRVEKRYLALVHGNLEVKEGTVDAPIYRPEEGELAGIKRIVDKRGQRSITHYKVVESFNNMDLVECLLETGRTHQIRVHMAHLGHPIIGDFLYGNGDEEKHLIDRQALHAYGLNFESPKTKKPLELRADLPKDMVDLIEKYRN